MVKGSKWLRSLFTGKKDTQKCASNHNSSATHPEISVPPTTPKDKRRWSFRRSHAPTPVVLDSDKKHAMAMARATAATKIQSAFRSYLARRALIALRGLVKLQALVRGHLVRKQATATIRCLQALITAQSRARAQRIQAIKQNHRRSTEDRLRLRRSCNDMDGGLEEMIKMIEMESNHRCSNSKPSENRDVEHCRHSRDYGFSSPQCYSKLGSLQETEFDYSLFPNYMTNTESSRAKARSLGVPKHWSADSFARRRRASMEGRNSSHQNYQYPWLSNLHQTALHSDCGSTNNYCGPVAGYYE